MSIKLSIRNTKLIAASFFILIGLLSLIDTLWNKQGYYLRDVVIVLILSSPMLINKRLYYIFFGFTASIISLILFIVYATQNTPWQIKDSTFLFYLSGCLLYLLTLVCSITLLYVGTYSKEHNRFQLT